MATYTASRSLTEVNQGRLALEIQALSLTQPLEGITYREPNIINCVFTSSLTSGDETLVDNAVSAHNKAVGDAQDNLEEAEGAVDDLIGLNDVDITSVESVGSFLYKSSSGDWKAIHRESFYKSNLTVQTSTSGTSIINTVVTLPRTGNYIIEVDYNWSLDSTTVDMETAVLCNGNVLDPIGYNRTHKQEAKDSSGSDSMGRGTNQIHGYNKRFLYTATGIGAVPLVVNVHSGANNVEASIWNTFITIQEEPNLTIL